MDSNGPCNALPLCSVILSRMIKCALALRESCVSSRILPPAVHCADLRDWHSLSIFGVLAKAVPVATAWALMKPRTQDRALSFDYKAAAQANTQG